MQLLKITRNEKLALYLKRNEISLEAAVHQLGTTKKALKYFLSGEETFLPVEDLALFVDWLCITEDELYESEWCKIVRERLNMTQPELAKEIGMLYQYEMNAIAFIKRSYGKICAFEHQKNKPNQTQ